MRIRMQGALWARIGVIAVVLITLASLAQAKDKRELVVMTQNVYLGSSLQAAIGASSPEEFVFAVAQIYGTVQFTNFPARAEAIADQIAMDNPDIIGLQEVSDWEVVNFAPGRPAPPSYDFLEILQAALDARGLSYSVAAVSNNADIGPIPLALCLDPTIGIYCTVSLLDRDVILVNDDNPALAVFNPQSGNYVAQNVLDTPVGPLSFNRGWASVDGLFEGKKFRFVNTHLETEDAPEVQEEQGQELLAGPAKAGGAVIAVGDFNSAADGSTTATYADLTMSYFSDAWDPNEPGDTCCQNSTLTNPTSQLGSRIDLVLTHAAVRGLSAYVIGDMPFQATPPFWPADHAGVIATLRIH